MCTVYRWGTLGHLQYLPVLLPLLNVDSCYWVGVECGVQGCLGVEFGVQGWVDLGGYGVQGWVGIGGCG